jgi:hypothetical protein
MLLILIVGLLEGVFVDLRGPAATSWAPVIVPRPEISARRLMVPEWPSGFL